MFGLKPWTKAAMLPRFETPFGRMLEEFPVLFHRMFAGGPEMETPEWPFPWGVMMEAKEKELLIRLELPGFEPEELKVEVMPERLLVEAEHKEPVEKPEKKGERKRALAYVKREVALPFGLEVEKAEALYRHGVLEVRLPRKEELVGRRLEVKTGSRARKDGA
jgi:HSP20 family protein